MTKEDNLILLLTPFKFKYNLSTQNDNDQRQTPERKHSDGQISDVSFKTKFTIALWVYKIL